MTDVMETQKTVYAYHPLSDIWPLVEGDEFDKLVADILSNGLRLPIILYDNKILDGRNRDRACIKANVQPRYEQADVKNDDEALALVISLNEHRRHLSMMQRALTAAKIANIKNGHNQFKTSINKEEGISVDRPSPENTSLHTVEQAAKIMDVSVASVNRAKAVLKHGTPELVKEVQTGKKSLYVAAKTAVATAKAKKEQKNQKKHTPSPVVRMGASGPPVKRILTRQDVDPEFVGTELEFVREYGHVWIETALERATNRFRDWSIQIKGLAKQFNFPLEVDINWLRSPKPDDVRRMEEGVEILKDILAKAEAMLLKAKSKHAIVPPLQQRGDNDGNQQA